jgi:hypothetical protein
MRGHPNLSTLVIEVVGSAAICGVAWATELILARRRTAHS